ncbi:hypothetical protein BDZ94DRAFT_1252388 [Collybia nuda]|uniref:Uncharacterized protein n=1 Tax=Collybia nuda TaxID=64659 RepID=A0A9P6CH53_9AGAR|nr:hypothetical protein BDZ94DRAFT_1252388 [Collybia nuda]
MNLDPLLDTPPPRYAIESDDEEDEYNPLHSSPLEPHLIVDVNVVGDLPKKSKLVLATGEVAKYWARGANLGEQNGGIYVNKIQIGSIFNPVWTTATVVISETLTRLPAWAMHDYARVILNTLNPTKLSLLDMYAVPSYVSEDLVKTSNAPLRYIATSAVGPELTSEAEPFLPPNLIQSVSASFLLLISTKYGPIPGTLILVPSLHIPQAPPKAITPSNYSRLSGEEFEWSRDHIDIMQRLIFLAIGEKELPGWEYDQSYPKEHVLKGSYQFGEGGMYI